jgi:hypothetical protein
MKIGGIGNIFKQETYIENLTHFSLLSFFPPSLPHFLP